MRHPSIQPKRELWLARASLALTAFLYIDVIAFVGERMVRSYEHGATRLFAETILLTIAIITIAYGNLVYHAGLLGYYKRRISHNPASADTLDEMYEGNAPALAILIPSYKEEARVVWQTMMSAALAVYPKKRVVLLVDDPHQPRSSEDALQLEAARQLPIGLSQLFAPMAASMQAARAAFETRRAAKALEGEAQRVAMLYIEAADWLHAVAEDFRAGQTLPFAEQFFVDRILIELADKHRARAAAVLEAPADEASLARQYARLAGLFNIEFASFERKKYANLSHEANKAMNLNSYIDLMGKSWREVHGANGVELHESTAGEADFIVPHADYINTIDADSFMLSDYALRLIHHMEQPENARIAVAQSPCSAIPGSPVPIERVAGACIDVQYHTHIGYEHWDATYWVGANAILRRVALDEIHEVNMVDGKRSPIYIQDRTVIEDTESTIDLVSKGWKLYNYLERMTFSATPPDFGSLLIQRRRWSNGGLIIMPKLMAYFWKAKKDLRLAKEMFMRVNYLALTTANCLVTLVFYFFPFSNHMLTPALVYASLPMLILYARDLHNCGHRYSDMLRICVLNLMLFPVIVGGVFKQFNQMITGRKIPFGRTPKIPGRTAAPALYCLFEIGLVVYFGAMAAHYMVVENWAKLAFASFNGVCFGYALVRFIGVRAAFEDIAAGLRRKPRKATASDITVNLPSIDAALAAALPVKPRMVPHHAEKAAEQTFAA